MVAGDPRAPTWRTWGVTARSHSAAPRHREPGLHAFVTPTSASVRGRRTIVNDVPPSTIASRGSRGALLERPARRWASSRTDDHAPRPSSVRCVSRSSVGVETFHSSRRSIRGLARRSATPERRRRLDEIDEIAAQDEAEVAEEAKRGRAFCRFELLEVGDCAAHFLGHLLLGPAQGRTLGANRGGDVGASLLQPSLDGRILVIRAAVDARHGRPWLGARPRGRHTIIGVVPAGAILLGGVPSTRGGRDARTGLGCGGAVDRGM